MTNIWAILAILDLALATSFSLFVLQRRKSQAAITLSWLLAFFLLPVLGCVLYVLIGIRAVRRRKRRKPRPSHKVGEIAAEEIKQAMAELARDPEMARIAELGKKLTKFPVEPGNSVHFIQNTAESYGRMAAAISNAKHHVHLEYYILQPDESGLFFRDLLMKKARDGVKCRLLVDHIGSYRLKKAFIQPMIEAGVEFAFFWPVRITRPWGLQLRNHRKIAIVDSAIGFVGSQNIGDEYVRHKRHRLSWKDALVEIRGPAVRQLQAIFLEDWEFTTDKRLDSGAYLGEVIAEGSSLVQCLPTGPDEYQFAFELVLTSLIYSATKRVTITTPYLIPSLSFLMAIESAAKRGIEVEILVPFKSDHWFVDAASRSWYRDILEAGGALYSYSETFLHAKVVTIDDRLTFIGSANMDQRSFSLNFECSLLIYDSDVTDQLVKFFADIKSQSKKVRFRDTLPRTLLHAVGQGALRVISPLL